MIPILDIILEGIGSVWRYTRAHPGHVAAIFLVFIAKGLIGGAGGLTLPLPPWLSGLMLLWLLDVVSFAVLAPVWTAIYRHGVLGDLSRTPFEWDIRTRRVLLAGVIMAGITLLGAIPFALGLDLLPRLGTRRAVAFGAIAFACLVKIGAFWLNARLAIAPAMGAAGAKPQFLDTAFSNSRHSAASILMAMFVVYLPLLGVVGLLMFASVLISPMPGTTEFTVLKFANAGASILFGAGTELVWAGVTARFAPALIRFQRDRAKRRARDDED